MRFFFRRPKQLLKITSILFLTFFIGIGAGYLFNHVFSENARFEKFINKIFQSEVTGNTLTLHYSLAHPEKYGISRPEPTLGTINNNIEETLSNYQTYENTLKNFSFSKLSRENQITLDMLMLYFHTQQDLKELTLLEEPLSPSLGIQAQLPILLAEYAFYENQDIIDYLKLLQTIEPYFQSILTFEQQKAQAGYFMSDATLDRVLDQCRSFIENPESNYMLEVFADKIAEYGAFSPEEQKKLNTKHKEIILSCVIPAYQQLIIGLEELRGHGQNSRGLAGFPNGQKYYEYLLKNDVGTYSPVSQIERRLSQQLVSDCSILQNLFKTNPSIINKLSNGTDLPDFAPDKILSILQEKITASFPFLENKSYEIRFVHKSMEAHLSPAFYLTPPLDTRTPNVIYINQASQNSNLDLFTTLAHEGFPGHLYQTVYFGEQAPSNIRYLINSSGYVEGWATYIESFAGEYAAEYLEDASAAEITYAHFLNRSINLCIYSLLDIGIHYHGWSQNQAARFLNTFGIRDTAAIQEINQYIIETPANYLKYYWGYLNFLDLRTSWQKHKGKDYCLKDFHEAVLTIGPVPFPVLRKYLFSQ